MRIRRALAAALAVLLTAWAGTAGAATYYVSPSGSATNAGTSASPWSLAKANSSLVAGDVAILAAGDYGSTSIAPANSGTSYANVIAYVGSLAAPSGTAVAGVSFGTHPYVSVKGVRFGSDIAMAAAHDSLGWCTSTAAAVRIEAGGDDCVITNCDVTGQQLEIAGATNSATPTSVFRDTLRNSTFHLNLTGYGPAMRVYASDGLYASRCRFYVNIGTTGNHGTFKMYGGRRGKFIDCLFDYQNQHVVPSGDCDECATSYYRDYTIFNLFQRDTFYMHGPQRLELMPSASGSYYQSTQGNKWDSCVFRQDAPGNMALLYWEDGSRADTLVNCTLVAKDLTPIYMRQFAAGCVVKNNTFVQLNSPGPAASLASWSGAATVTNNIFCATIGSASGSTGAAVSGDASVSSGYWVGNNNLYWCTNPAASSFYVSGSARGPGASGTLCTSYGTDCASKYGDPLFVGGSDAQTFDVHVKTGSPAIGGGVGGADIGALPFGSGGSDTTPPGTVGDLVGTNVTATSVTLRWTAPGDDGSSGTATAYDLRWSGLPITAANFGSATPVSPQPAVAAGGTTQTYVVLSLSPSSVYHFALRAVDEAGNWSVVSNDAAVGTPAVVDTTPPAAIGDLRID